MVKDDCIFCKLANGVFPTNALYEDDKVKVILDAGPASKGHALILPKNHADNLFELSDEDAMHITVVAKKVGSAIMKALKPLGMNVVQNNGEAAGQTVLHYHTHLIPRYEGDSVNVGWVPGENTSEDASAIIAAVKESL